MKQEYSAHFYEQIRIRIARDLIEKECRKLFTSIRDPKIWQLMDRDIANWFDGKASELASVHDFWNGLEGIMRGFKLKDILTYLTAENIKWTLTVIPVNKIIFSANLSSLEKIARVPFDSQILIDYLKDNEQARKDFEKEMETHSATSINRDDYPIMVLKSGDKFQLLDGHRRTLQAITYNKRTINAYCAEYLTEDKFPKNYWVSVGFLRNLVRLWDIYIRQNKTKEAEAIVKILQNLYDEHENVHCILPKRVLDKKPYSDIKIKL